MIILIVMKCTIRPQNVYSFPFDLNFQVNKSNSNLSQLPGRLKLVFLFIFAFKFEIKNTTIQHFRLFILLYFLVLNNNAFPIRSDELVGFIQWKLTKVTTKRIIKNHFHGKCTSMISFVTISIRWEANNSFDFYFLNNFLFDYVSFDSHKRTHKHSRLMFTWKFEEMFGRFLFWIHSLFLFARSKFTPRIPIKIEQWKTL